MYKSCSLLFSGVGIATMVMVTYYNIYYCVIVAWSLYYFVASFVAIPDLPWNTCGNLPKAHKRKRKKVFISLF